MLVHCNAGVSSHIDSIIIIPGIFQISRAPSVVIAYLIMYQGLAFDRAFTLVKSKRTHIKPNDGFIEQLKNLSVPL